MQESDEAVTSGDASTLYLYSGSCFGSLDGFWQDFVSGDEEKHSCAICLREHLGIFGHSTLLTSGLEKLTISYHINKQGCHSDQRLQPSRSTRKENNTGIWQLLGCSHSLPWVLRKNSGYWSQTTEIHMKGMISVSPDSCIFPYIQKY